MEPSKKTILKTFRRYAGLLRDIKRHWGQRSAALDELFWEFQHMNIWRFEDRETRLARICPERRAYPSSFFGSSLGFNRSSMHSRYNEVLNKFDLGRRPRVATLENSLLYEKLKLLMIKYYEAQK